MQAECRQWCQREGLDYELNVGPSKITPENRQLIAQLRDLLASKLSREMLTQHQAFLTDATVMRFLIARQLSLDNAAEMLIGCLEWRSRRSIDLLRARMFSHECETGKIFRPGLDRWGRPLMCFNNTCQNTDDSESHMMFLAWNMEECERACGSNGASKYCLFVNLEEFSLFNNPPFSETRETVFMVANAYPERMGTAIVYKPPWVFKQVWNLVKGLMDPRTHSKIVFMVGDTDEGSQNDRELCRLIGSNWREMTGVKEGLSTTNQELKCQVAPGYNHSKNWAMTLAAERAYGLPETDLTLEEAIRLANPPSSWW